ncbi:preprotein translocase subunit SecG [Candidatus Saccharibacteria bacterium]|nr:preprotein translocase subunit SecG [Candidatus Saccharibacteria bacterium]MBI3338357.1 preprotein translocase subunit SecG [Candidatus Saccharibacteria bacterium]
MSIYNYIAIGSMILMTILILIQTRGASLGAGMGGGGEINTVRRGSDRTLHQMTIMLAFIFAASLILGIVV